jgi:hypothetical protein
MFNDDRIEYFESHFATSNGPFSSALPHGFNPSGSAGPVDASEDHSRDGTDLAIFKVGRPGEIITRLLGP